MQRHMDKPDPSQFPPQPRWATWIKDRSPQFKLHNHLGLAKNALSGRPLKGARGRYSNPVKRTGHEYPLEGGYVYEYVIDDATEGWVERFHVPEGAFKSDHPLWQYTAKERPVRPASQKAINEAIASIIQD